MKKLASTLITALILIFPLISLSSSFAPFRTGLVEGDVEVNTENTSGWMDLLVNTPLMERDRIRVPGSGRLEIQLDSGSFLRLDHNSFLTVNASERQNARFTLHEGDMFITLGGTEDPGVQVDTPDSSVEAYGDSRFRVYTRGYGSTEISVYRGVVFAEGRSGTIRVSAGNALKFGERDFADVSPLGMSDEWERWNQERDRTYDKPVLGSRYLPEELRIYAGGLDESGKWIYTSDYGYVWTPTVIVSSGWAPYRFGRWDWMGGDYVWVSYEPWGWAPYHYGRWAFRVSIGWFWVPPVKGQVYWGPGYVGWIYTPAYVSWLPLAPGDIYYGYGYYGPWSVNIIDIDIHKTVVRNVYKNVHIDRAVTIVQRDSFKKGRYVDFRTKENPFLRHREYAGRPAIKPFESVSGDRKERAIRIQPSSEPPKKPVTRKSERQITPAAKERRNAVSLSSSVFKKEGTERAERKARLPLIERKQEYRAPAIQENLKTSEPRTRKGLTYSAPPKRNSSGTDRNDPGRILNISGEKQMKRAAGFRGRNEKGNGIMR